MKPKIRCRLTPTARPWVYGSGWGGGYSPACPDSDSQSGGRSKFTGAWAAEAMGVDGHGSRWIPGDDVTSTLTTSCPGVCLGQGDLSTCTVLRLSEVFRICGRSRIPFLGHRPQTLHHPLQARRQLRRLTTVRGDRPQPGPPFWDTRAGDPLPGFAVGGNEEAVRGRGAALGGLELPGRRGASREGISEAFGLGMALADISWRLGGSDGPS